MEKNEIREGIVNSIGYNGEGIIKEDNFVIFVPFSLPGEKISYKVLKVHKNIVYGKLLEVKTPAENRERPICSVYTKCGGCQYQHLRYYRQLKQKSLVVQDCLKKIAKFNIEVPLTVKSDLIYGYRNKLVIPVNRDESGVKIGFYACNSHRIVDTTDCSLHSSWVKDVIQCFRTYIAQNNVYCYSEQDKNGSLRHIVVREINGKFIIVAVTKDKLKNVDKLIEILQTKFKFFSLYINYNDKDTNVVTGENFDLVYGESGLMQTDFGITYEVGPQTFLQVNNGVKIKLYSDIKKFVSNCNANFVIDAYSGAGLLSSIIAKSGNTVHSVEIVKEACVYAEKLAKNNGIQEKMIVHYGDCSIVIPQIIEGCNGDFQIILDPPRKGVDRKLLSLIKNSKPKQIIYCSCSPQTLSRDLGIILGTINEESGEIVKNDLPVSEYEISYIQPYDMFPQTKHVETLVVLSHKKPDSHIEVKIDFDNTSLDKSAIAERAEKRKPKDKPTYKDIQDWVEKNYGFKVHTAYIAEVKRNEGLPMYDAPNAVEELKRPRSHPTAEMVEAIKDALKHFGII